MAENLSNQLDQVLRECLLEVQDDIEIPPAALASCALRKLDPEGMSPVLVAWGCNLELRQMARAILRREYDPVQQNIEPMQVEMFEGLQDRYPCKRGGDYVYVKRMHMTLEERLAVESRMERDIESRTQHLDGFRAETAELIARGHFEEIA